MATITALIATASGLIPFLVAGAVILLCAAAVIKFVHWVWNHKSMESRLYELQRDSNFRGGQPAYAR